LYAYASDSPSNLVDPYGLLTIPGVGWVPAGESYAEYASQYYADIAGDPSSSTWARAAATVAGTAAEAWNYESSDDTAQALFLALALAAALDSQGGADAPDYCPDPGSKPDDGVGSAADAIEGFLGGPGEVKRNKAGDPVIVRGDKKVRFDINNTNGDAPHFHLERRTPDGRWRDAGPKHRYYFK
jgi:hypothetical protein